LNPPFRRWNVVFKGGGTMCGIPGDGEITGSGKRQIPCAQSINGA